jgi:uncharacterized protein (TIGR02147 family)
MPELSRYSDYRQFLNDYYQERRKNDRHFSFFDFSRRAGIKSKGFLHNVIHGKRNLNSAHIEGLCRVFRFGAFESNYFRYLVGFNQAVDTKKRASSLARLLTVKSRGKRAWKAQVLRNDQFEFYSQYHHSVIRSLIGLFGFNGDYKKLSDKVYPSLTPRKARLSFELLLRLGLVKKSGKQYVLSDPLISTPPEITSQAVVDHHRQCLELGKKTLVDLPAQKRNISSVTLGISEKTYENICEEIETFRFHLLDIAKADTNADRVYQFNFQMIPVSKSSRRGRKPR